MGGSVKQAALPLVTICIPGLTTLLGRLFLAAIKIDHICILYGTCTDSWLIVTAQLPRSRLPPFIYLSIDQLPNHTPDIALAVGTFGSRIRAVLTHRSYTGQMNEPQIRSTAYAEDRQ